MKSGILDIKSLTTVPIFADKSSNFYKATPQDYNQLLKDNITKSYKKQTDRLEKAVNMEAKNTPKKIQLNDWIEYLAKTPFFCHLERS